jgi:hypothetical protein
MCCMRGGERGGGAGVTRKVAADAGGGGQHAGLSGGEGGGGRGFDEGWQEHCEAAGGGDIRRKFPTCGMTTQAALVRAQPGLQARHAPNARLWEVAVATYGGTQSLHVAKGVEQASGAHIHRLGEA